VTGGTGEARTAPGAGPPAVPAAPSGGGARIFDRGYRRYDGPRTGLSGALRTLVLHSAQRALGLGRPARHKVLPVAVAGMAYVPAVVFVGLAAFLPGDLGEDALPSYAEYYGFVSAAIMLFTAFVAPELLCTDRRTGMLGLYLASPLDRRTYLLGKAVAVLGILAIVTLGPPLLMLIALTLEGSGPGGVGDFVVLLARIVAAGLAVSLVQTSLSLAVAATTDRKAAATATIVGLLIGSGAVTAALVEGGGLTQWVFLGNLLSLPLELVFRIHGEVGDTDFATVPTWAIVAAQVAWVALATAWIWDRYRRLVVRR
jgi:ABC-2 type transport system permease protein